MTCTEIQQLSGCCSATNLAALQFTWIWTCVYVRVVIVCKSSDRICTQGDDSPCTDYIHQHTLWIILYFIVHIASLLTQRTTAGWTHTRTCNYHTYLISHAYTSRGCTCVRVCAVRWLSLRDCLLACITYLCVLVRHSEASWHRPSGTI